MDRSEETINRFICELASASPTPGGGGAAALTAAIGTALCSMTGSIIHNRSTDGSLEQLIRECTDLENQLLHCMQEDEDGFTPLAEAYSIPRDSADRAAAIGTAAETACLAPMHIMELCCKAIDTAQRLEGCTPDILLSDLGCSAAILSGALRSASLNVFINTKQMTDRASARLLNEKCSAMLSEYGQRAEALFRRTADKLM